MNNSQVITQGEAEYNFDCYEYNYSLIALICIEMPTHHIALYNLCTIISSYP